MASIKSSELITNEDGSIFHLHLLPEDLADDIILVGDPGRVETIASHFQQIELKKSNREFYTITGSYRGHRLSVISTGIGPDNIDIVINELDALAHIDLKTKEIKAIGRTLNIVRIGTSGSVQADIPVVPIRRFFCHLGKKHRLRRGIEVLCKQRIGLRPSVRRSFYPALPMDPLCSPPLCSQCRSRISRPPV